MFSAYFVTTKSLLLEKNFKIGYLNQSTDLDCGIWQIEKNLRKTFKI